VRKSLERVVLPLHQLMAHAKTSIVIIHMAKYSIWTWITTARCSLGHWRRAVSEDHIWQLDSWSAAIYGIPSQRDPWCCYGTACLMNIHGLGSPRQSKLSLTERRLTKSWLAKIGEILFDSHIKRMVSIQLIQPIILPDRKLSLFHGANNVGSPHLRLPMRINSGRWSRKVTNLARDEN
jgi:hypothetical protein